MELVRTSEHHKDWDDDLIMKYIEEPLGIRQYKVLRDDDMIPLMFATWAFPSEKHVAEYHKTQYFPVDGYKGGGKRYLDSRLYCKKRLYKKRLCSFKESIYEKWL
jgi:hemolysin-activating ACP:hemolysin acyltransferase